MPQADEWCPKDGHGLKQAKQIAEKMQ